MHRNEFHPLQKVTQEDPLRPRRSGIVAIRNRSETPDRSADRLIGEAVDRSMCAAHSIVRLGDVQQHRSAQGAFAMSLFNRILTYALGLFLMSSGIAKFTGGHVFQFIEYQSGLDIASDLNEAVDSKLKDVVRAGCQSAAWMVIPYPMSSQQRASDPLVNDGV
jgi:hypothetical protein